MLPYREKKTENIEVFTGKISVSGERCAVCGHTEHRNAVLFSPGGYLWRPDRGDEVLVFKCGETDILGKKCENADLLPGEVCLRSKGGAEIRLSNDGNIYIKGKIITEGE